MSVKSRTELD